ncbi:hypothetical protein SESBI_50131 [Sesbania bispinosa]|nr:hypothetical protein SESBI_50131 [Sesbania bispinosa]
MQNGTRASVQVRQNGPVCLWGMVCLGTDSRGIKGIMIVKKGFEKHFINNLI